MFDIETCGLFVEAICTDNYPLNVSLYKLFSDDGNTLHPKVVHPCNPDCNLVLFFDIVHIIKSIRNNWLNFKDFEKTFIYPKFDECDKSVYPSCIQLRVSVPTADIVLNPIQLTRSRYPPICYAVFDDLRILFKADKFSIIKGSPK